MIKKVIMKNLMCTGCATKIEHALTKRPDIVSANFNFATQTMLLEVTNAYDMNQSIPTMQALVDDIEDGVKVYPYEQRHTIQSPSLFKRHKLVIIGVAIFLLGLVLERLFGLTRTNPLYWGAYILASWRIGVAAYKSLRNKSLFDEHTLMIIATMAAMFIDKPIEAFLVIVFYTVGEHLQQKAVATSQKEVRALVDLHVEYANVWENDAWVLKDPMGVVTGDTLLVKPGERIPVDGAVTKGKTALNTSALTGESTLQDVAVGDAITSGTINVGHAIEMRAMKPYEESMVAKIIDLIENAPTQKSKREQFITRFAKVYTPVVIVMALLMATIPTAFNPAQANDYIFRAATFLVISCPCALVLSVPLSYFSGIGAAARRGILFKGANFLDMMGSVDVIGLDKTGTLTHGNFVVDGYTNYETLKMAAALEQYSTHPIAKSIVNALDTPPPKMDSVSESPGLGLQGDYRGDTYTVGSQKYFETLSIDIPETVVAAGTNVFLAKNSLYQGQILIKDAIRESSLDAMHSLGKNRTILMLTGDHEENAKDVAQQLGNIMYKPNLLPGEKIAAFNSVPKKGVAMYVGDGVNDAPLIKNADIGVAMGQGSELAIDVADIIITDDELDTLVDAFSMAASTRRIVMQNIVFSIGIKFIFLILAGLGSVTMLMAIFADVGITVIAVLNALRLIHTRKGVIS